jgi:dihydroneopterin aldolase
MTPAFAFEVASYRKRIVIGCADEEQLSAQEVIFDLKADVARQANLLVDAAHPVFDYCVLTDAVDAACAMAGPRILQEPLAFEVLERIFESSSLVEALEIFVRKTERYADTESIGFRLRLTRAQCADLGREVGRLRQSPATRPAVP